VNPQGGALGAAEGESAVKTVGLTKSYGKARGIVSIDLEVRRGEVFGLLGPNGAGKTTLLRCLLDLIRPTSGSAQVLGLDAQTDSTRVRERVGYLPGEFSLWPGLSAMDTQDFAARVRGNVDPRRVEALMERFHLKPGQLVGEMSRGNKQKVGLVMALAPQVELYVLDEPTGGLDPLMQQQFRDVVREETERGATVLLSSHVMHEVEHLAHRVGVLREGELVLVDSVHALRGRAARTISITFSGSPPVDALAQVPGVAVLRSDDHALDVRVTGAMDPFIKALAAFEVLTLDAPEPDLEDIFLEYYGPGGAA
jgi:ABC-2 type transport system ATP-binding protein